MAADNPADAMIQAHEHQRSLRVVGEVSDRDISVVEDRETGERRYVPGKARMMYGLRVAFELGELLPTYAAAAPDDADDLEEALDAVGKAR